MITQLLVLCNIYIIIYMLYSIYMSYNSYVLLLLLLYIMPADEWPWAHYAFIMLSTGKLLLCPSKGNYPTFQDI